MFRVARSCAAAALLAAALTTPGPAAARPPDRHRAQRQPTTRVAVSITNGGRGVRVPRDFLGLSFEIKYAPDIGAMANRGNLVALLRAIGPGLLRLGGVTADTQLAWSPDGRALPAWATRAITARDLAALAVLTRRAGWRALLSVNLGHHDPSGAAEETSVAARAFGPALAGIELGNEPSAFVTPDHLRSAPWSFPDYQAEISPYLTAIRARARRVALAGPDAPAGASQIASWMIPEAAYVRPALLTEHYYSYSCAQLPTALDLLVPAIRRREAGILARMAAVSVGSRIPLRLDETNNVSCGGLAGVSNTFASSLWAIDFLSRAMSAGFAGVNFHDVVATPLGYSPLVASSPAALAAGHLEARPEFYAMLMARPLEGERALAARVTPRGLNVSASAFMGSAAEHVLIVDDQLPGARALSVRLPRPPGYTTGTVLRLSAASPVATTGVTLGGTGVSTSGTWRPRRNLAPVMRVGNDLRVTVAPSSAALVTLITHPGRR